MSQEFAYKRRWKGDCIYPLLKEILNKEDYETSKWEDINEISDRIVDNGKAMGFMHEFSKMFPNPDMMKETIERFDKDKPSQKIVLKSMLEPLRMGSGEGFCDKEEYKRIFETSKLFHHESFLEVLRWENKESIRRFLNSIYKKFDHYYHYSANWWIEKFHNTEGYQYIDAWNDEDTKSVIEAFDQSALQRAVTENMRNTSDYPKKNSNGAEFIFDAGFETAEATRDEKYVKKVASIASYYQNYPKIRSDLMYRIEKMPESSERKRPEQFKRIIDFIEGYKIKANLEDVKESEKLYRQNQLVNFLSKIQSKSYNRIERISAFDQKEIYSIICSQKRGSDKCINDIINKIAEPENYSTLLLDEIKNIVVSYLKE
ncbi:MAG: hypothetical protein ACOYT4_02115 [Nanoarchaeota archaeon]